MDEDVNANNDEDSDTDDLDITKEEAVKNQIVRAKKLWNQWKTSDNDVEMKSSIIC
jgi:hypothetical protein